MKLTISLGALCAAAALALPVAAQNGVPAGSQNRTDKASGKVTTGKNPLASRMVHRLGETTVSGRTVNTRTNATEKDNADLGQTGLNNLKRSNVVDKDNSSLYGASASSQTRTPFTINHRRRTAGAGRSNSNPTGYRLVGVVASHTTRAKAAQKTRAHKARKSHTRHPKRTT